MDLINLNSSMKATTKDIDHRQLYIGKVASSTKHQTTGASFWTNQKGVQTPAVEMFDNSDVSPSKESTTRHQIMEQIGKYTAGNYSASHRKS